MAMVTRGLLPLLPLMLLGACASAGPPPVGTVFIDEAPAAREEWRDVINPADGDRLDRADQAWNEALSRAYDAGFRRQIEAEGALLDPEAMLARAAPAPGSYRCRVIKLGGEGRRNAFRAFNPFFCHVGVEGDLLSITKQTGSERPGGYLHPWNDDRLVFLGSMALGSEDVPRAYGEDGERDMAGLFERIGPFRYRLIVPWPRGDSRLDVFELIPAVEPMR